MEAAREVKQEIQERPAYSRPRSGSLGPAPFDVIDLSSSDDEDGGSEDEEGAALGKRARVSGSGGEVGKRRRSGGKLPEGFLDPLSPVNGGERAVWPATVIRAGRVVLSRQFWKAGDYEGSSIADLSTSNGIGMDHVKVHPKFLHSNATSHKWALGAFAELLDNALDEVCSGATFVNIDVLHNKKDGTRMLLIEDDGGGMNPDKVRLCMSLGYSAKSKIPNTIGQYGNGFKTSTMRLGADVIVFSRSLGKDGSPTQSIGMLSYTFLTSTAKEEIVVPMLDYEKVGQVWQKMARFSSVEWNTNLETIVQWSPYSSETDLLQQFDSIGDHGTRIIIYNLWEDDQGELELDFDADMHDIQLRGVNRDEKKIQMATQYPHARHFLTYRHSLRIYASIIYLRLPHVFRMILRGKEIEHHNIVNDMMLKKTITYRPQSGADGISKDPDMAASVTIGFVKGAKDHIDVQGFNVYHKNRLIKPFWRVWNAAGSGGRGVFGVLEANFVEPAHDKQDFERTIVLSRLETKLIHLQKTYWATNCHEIGYARLRDKKLVEAEETERLPHDSWVQISDDSTPVSRSQEPTKFRCPEKSLSHSNGTEKPSDVPFASAKSAGNASGCLRESEKRSTRMTFRSYQSRLYGSFSESDSETEYVLRRRPVSNESGGSKVLQKSFRMHTTNPAASISPCPTEGAGANSTPDGLESQIANTTQLKGASVTSNGNCIIHEDSESRESRIKQLKDENETLRIRIMKTEEKYQQELDLERNKNKLLTEQLEAAKKRLEQATQEQEALVDIFGEERSRRDKEEVALRNKLKEAVFRYEDLMEKLKLKRDKSTSEHNCEN